MKKYLLTKKTQPKKKSVPTEDPIVDMCESPPTQPKSKCCGRPKKHVPKAIPASEPRVAKKRFPKMFKPNKTGRPSKSGVSGFADLVWNKKYDDN
jgi:hypothetical protein